MSSREIMPNRKSRKRLNSFFPAHTITHVREDQIRVVSTTTPHPVFGIPLYV